MRERREMLASRQEEESTFPLGKDNKDPHDEVVDCEYPETALELREPVSHEVQEKNIIE